MALKYNSPPAWNQLADNATQAGVTLPDGSHARFISYSLIESGDIAFNLPPVPMSEVLVGFIYGVDGAVPVLTPPPGGSISYANGKVPVWQSKAGTIDAIRILTSDGLNFIVWQ